jgi:hypothetical protein
MAQNTTDVYGNTRATTEIFNGSQGQEAPMLFNNRGDELVAQALPSKAELTRMGAMWTMRTATGSVFTAVVGLPTTLAVAILYNGEPSGGKSYVIDSAFYLNSATSFAAVNQVALIAQLQGPAVATKPTGSTTTTIINSCNGKPTYGGAALRAINVTTMVADYWTVLAPSSTTTAAATLGLGVYAELWGGFIVPPGGAFGINLVSGIVTGTGIVGITWAEVQLALG